MRALAEAEKGLEKLKEDEAKKKVGGASPIFIFMSFDIV